MTMHPVLIVDDEAPMRRYLSRLVEPLDLDVSVAEDGAEALEMVRGGKFDLVISDLKMPRMDGLALLENIRRDGNDAAFILLTAYADLDVALAARERFNIANFLVKPIHNQDQFLFDVTSALQRRELEIRNRQLMDALTTANLDLERKVIERTQELIDKNMELARLSQFRADVLRVLSHELRTPLALVRGYLGLASGARRSATSRIQQLMGAALDRVQGIVDKSIRQIREAESSRFDIDPGPLDPWTMCREVVERLEPLLQERDVRIELDSARVGQCLWDRVRVESIIEELLTNAIRASKDGGRIALYLAEAGGQVTIAVEDQGAGISPADLERIFEPFVTLGEADHHSSGLFEYGAQGVGLGLSIAKTLAELQQGRITAVPNRGNPGTTFSLSLPREVRAG